MFRVWFFAHRRNQFVTDDFDELLPRRQALINFMTNRFLFYAIDKLTHYRQSDVRLQQRHAHFAQRIFYVVFSEASTATDIAQRARQTTVKLSNIVSPGWKRLAAIATHHQYIAAV